MQGKVDAVFKALADPSRRTLLDSLFERDGQTLGELCSRLEQQMTRFGVMKHLRVLEAGQLVVARRVGREKRHYLNAVPIRQIHDRWIGKYREGYSSALVDLKKTLEGTREKDDERLPAARVPGLHPGDAGAGLAGPDRR